MAHFYTDPFEHLSDELDYLDVLIEFAGVRTGLTASRAQNFPYQKSANGTGFTSQTGSAKNNAQSYLSALHEKREKINAQLEQTRERGISLPWQCLCDRFDLDPVSQQIVLICLGARLDRKYQKSFALLHDDLTKDYPTPEIVLLLTMWEPSLRHRMISGFSPQAPLRRWRIIEVKPDALGIDGSAVSPLSIMPAIAEYLLGKSDGDSILSGVAQVQRDESALDDLLLNDETKNYLKEISGAVQESISATQSQNKVSYYFFGPAGSGRTQAAAAVCNEPGLALLSVDVNALIQKEADFAIVIRTILRESILLPAAIVFRGCDPLFSDDPKAIFLRRQLLSETACVKLPVFFIGKNLPELFDTDLDYQTVSLEFSVPDATIRETAWKAACAAGGLSLCRESIELLAKRYRFTPGRIFSIVNNSFRNPVPSLDESAAVAILQTQCSAVLAARLPRFATKITSPFSWDDLVLPSLQKEMLWDICLHVQHQGRVFEEWGFARKVATGRGINALFTGFSGTGKTMAAGIVANALGVDIYKIDLSLVVSKYIGETEKNLSAIFNEVDSAQAILFFDEADALFGKRSIVKDAHDRYANIEVAYLLQKMEEFEGITILATNLRQNMDEAFARRMHYIVEFPLPDREDRERLWRSVFPAEAPLGTIDYSFLARQFTISGANIRNIAVGAALCAAEKQEHIAMSHVLSAVKREYRKTGSFLSEETVTYDAEVPA
jgi:AAA+ superfamily predicted ATPase